jgi:hypothetical protein
VSRVEARFEEFVTGGAAFCCAFRTLDVSGGVAFVVSGFTVSMVAIAAAESALGFDLAHAASVLTPRSSRAYRISVS